MSPGVGFVVVLLGFVLVLGGIGLYARGRQQAFEASPATTVPVVTTRAGHSQAAQQPTAQAQRDRQSAQAPTQAAAPPAVASTAVPTACRRDPGGAGAAGHGHTNGAASGRGARRTVGWSAYLPAGSCEWRGGGGATCTNGATDGSACDPSGIAER